MFRFCDVIVEDCADIIKYALIIILLAGGSIACVAIASLTAHLVLLRPELGIQSFHTIMSFSGSGLVEPVRKVIETGSWIGLIGIVFAALRSTAHYFQSVAVRASRPNNVIHFPTPTNTSSIMGPGVANL